MRNSILFLIFSCFLFSCISSDDIKFEIIQTDTSYDFHAIITHRGLLVATSGDVWNRGDITLLHDNQWITDSISDKSIFGLSSYEDQLYGVGPNGYTFVSSQYTNNDTKDSLLSLRPNMRWQLLRAITADHHTVVAVGGSGFGKGWIFHMNDHLNILSISELKHQLEDITCHNGKCIAVGFGVIATWDTSEQNITIVDIPVGDHFRSITHTDNEELIVVGYQGSILRSSDEGQTWQTIQNGNSVFGRNPKFRKVKNFDGKLIAIGDNGLLWISIDDGMSWEDRSIDTKLDIFDFEILDGQLYGATEKGQIIRLPFY